MAWSVLACWLLASCGCGHYEMTARVLRVPDEKYRDKAPGGVIRATIEVGEGQWRYVSLSGDFFCHPKDALSDIEPALVGTPCAQSRDVLARFYVTHDIETPGVSVDDWVKALPKTV